MIRELCLSEDFVCIHSITPTGGAGKSEHNNEHIDIYDRFKFNINSRKGIATSIFKNIANYQKKFGPQGIVIHNGQINNVNRSDAGTKFNDSNNLWESIDGIQFPNVESAKNELLQAKGGYVEINVFDYQICGFFIDLTELSWLKTCIRSLNEFYTNTISFGLPYYGLSEMGIIELDPIHLKNEDWKRIQGGTFKNIKDIYDIKAKSI